MSGNEKEDEDVNEGLNVRGERRERYVNAWMQWRGRKKRSGEREEVEGGVKSSDEFSELPGMGTGRECSVCDRAARLRRRELGGRRGNVRESEELDGARVALFGSRREQRRGRPLRVAHLVVARDS